MGRQSSLIKITGKLDDLSFFKTKDGHMVRMKGVSVGLELKTILHSPELEKTCKSLQK